MMAGKITWTLNVQVSQGPNVSATDQLAVEAYDKIDVVVNGTDNGGDETVSTEVEIQPSAAGQVQFLLIKSSQYHATDLTYSVSTAEPDKTLRKKLDALQVLIGHGAVELLGPALDSLFFYSGLAEDVTIEVLVGRDATP